MKNHLQPVTARANAGIKKTSGCGCESKCGCGSPNKKMKSPAYMTDPDPKTGKANVGEIPGQEEIQQRFEGKYKVIPKKGKINEYTLKDKSGYSVSYKPGPKVKDESMTATQIINKQIKGALVGGGVIPTPSKKYGKKY